MSMEEVMKKLDDISGRMDSITEDITNLKQKDEREKTSLDETRGNRHRSKSRNRSPLESRRGPRRGRSHDHSLEGDVRSPSCDRTSERSWGDRDPAEPTDFSIPHFPEEEDGVELVEVSDGTHRFLKTVCIRSMSNDLRTKTRSAFKFPKVEATRTPRFDQVIRSLAPQSAKTSDRELARLQTFVLDSMAPLSALMELLSHDTDWVSIEDVRNATLTATELIGNASAQISHLRREKLMQSINKNLLPLVKEDGAFLEAPPNLFGPDFSKRAKDHLDQVKSLKAATLPTRPQSTGRSGHVFRRGHPLGRGQARGRGGGPTLPPHKTHSGEKPPRH